ncbi:hypothetical protein [Bordetella sp. 02P26C-1]|uniref:hypothetical protein n=1 Tax=Bordetella sp. 02P26C-1 TaxID=2683195 RepID=UPI001356092E|nr:hypothetical protein [Bordetella sp. 02P26C-1]MVW78833.1 hypothetical protein [Bordetella sp. 02P26C-1]
MLCILLVCGAAWVGLMRMSLAAEARVRLTHVADAVAYSGAVAQARSLNLLAYVNRAQVAHQVAMAHLMTLASLNQFAENLAAVKAAGDPPDWLLQRHFGEEAAAAYRMAHLLPVATGRLAGSERELIGEAIHRHDKIVHDVLLKAADGVVGKMRAMRDQTMLRVLRANYLNIDGNAVRISQADERDPAAAMQIVVSTEDPAASVARNEGRNSGEYRRWVEQAAMRYPFLQSRDLTSLSDWDARHDKRACGEKRFELRRRGHTLLDDAGHWSAQDSLSYHELQGNAGLACYYRENPLAWGQARDRAAQGPDGVRPPRKFSDVPFWKWVREHTTWDIVTGEENSLADTYADFDAGLMEARGLPAYYNVAEGMANQSLRFAIQLRQSLGSLHRRAAGPRLDSTSGGVLDTLTAGLAVTVGSAAQTYYSDLASSGLDSNSSSDQNHNLNASRNANASMSADLFRPRWRARLVPSNSQEASWQ